MAKHVSSTAFYIATESDHLGGGGGWQPPKPPPGPAPGGSDTSDICIYISHCDA